jgi:hypothetical protein
MPATLTHRLRALAASAAVSSIALGAFGGLAASQAQASVISLDACDGTALTQPFLPWGDPSSYKLVPGGNFEGSMAGWSLTGGAAVVPGSEPAGVTGSVGSSSLSLPPGAVVQSATTCVDAAYPSLRFFAQTDRPGSILAVSVVYQTLLGQTSLPVGVVTLSPNWAPTLPMLTGSVVGGLLSNGTAPVAVRFTELTGTAQIDDVFVDPHTMH